MGQYISFNDDHQIANDYYQDPFGHDDVCDSTLLSSNTICTEKTNNNTNSADNTTDVLVSNNSSFLSNESKNKLTKILLKNEIDNRKMDNFKHAQHDCLCRHVIDSLNQNINELSQENKMLRETLEKYKKLYFDRLPSGSESE